MHKTRNSSSRHAAAHAMLAAFLLCASTLARTPQYKPTCQPQTISAPKEKKKESKAHSYQTKAHEKALENSKYLKKLPCFLFRTEIGPALKELIEQETKEISGAFFHFHNNHEDSLTAAWIKAKKAKPELESILVVDWKLITPDNVLKSYENSNTALVNTATALSGLIKAGITVRCNCDTRGYNGQPATQHNKLLFFKSLGIVVTGSWNNTPSAAGYNWENMCVLQDPELYRQAYGEFKRMVRQSRLVTPEELEANKINGAGKRPFASGATKTYQRPEYAKPGRGYTTCSYDQMISWFV